MDRHLLDRKIKLGWLVAITFVTIIAAPREAAATPPTVEAVQIDLGVRYGLPFESLKYNPWAVGFGGAIGYTLDSAIYLGASFDWFQGEEVEYPAVGYESDPILVGGNYWQALVHGGWDMELSESFVFRPKVGVGWSTSTLRDCNTLIPEASGDDNVECRKTIKSDTTIAPGVQLIFVSPVTVSLEARFLMLFDSVTIKSAAIGALSIGF